MALEKFSIKSSNETRITEDEKEIFDELKKKCREKGIDHKIFIKKLSNLYRLR